MNNARFHQDMLEATRLTRAGRLADATRFLQCALHGWTAPAAAAGPEERATSDAGDGRHSARIIDLLPDKVEVSDHRPSSSAGTPVGDNAPRPPRPTALRGFMERFARGGIRLPGAGETSAPFPAEAPAIVPEGGRFVAGSYSTEAGRRGYKLYIPGRQRGRALPLVVMLHGCTQSGDDFAAGTRMNALAEEHTCLVAYPEQATAANASKCWNWFSPGDQLRDRGEPALIAGITRQVMRDHTVDPSRVYVAGLSAGGAAAAILGATYPDLYAAIGVHSGLACGAARDLPSAFAAMRQGTAAAATAAPGRRIVPAIVFHGDRDATVHPRNGDQVIAQSRAAAELHMRIERGQVPGGHAYSRTIYADASGRTILEQWVVHGAGHAWSGGSVLGSYTDPRGPDATREMLRFFLEHPKEV